MRTSRFTCCAAGAVLAFLASGLPVVALDGPMRPQAPAVGFRTAKEALRVGMRDYNAGNKLGAAQALEFAATKGDALALWKLGHMYAKGDGVEHDDLKAFEYFSKIADEHADEPPDSPNAGVVASAFVALGGYFLEGIKNTYVKPNASRAHEMFHYAASYFGDPNAQYNLARLYLDGNGVAQDVRQAARWFNLAAEKGHYQAQALLGHLLAHGEGVPRQRALGLMWLTLARDASDPARDQWIAKLYDRAFAAASERDRAAALSYLEQFMKRPR